MNILILQGPNLNLLGLKSSKKGFNLTLDKLNKSLRIYVRDKELTLKFLQTHKQYKALNFLQRNRNWADGLLFIPTSWARNEWTIKETLELISLPTVFVYFNKSYNFGTPIDTSIFKLNNCKSFSGDPIETCILALEHLISFKK